MIRSVTKNGRSILLTAVLAVILIYLFSIVGFTFFRDDFLIEIESLSEQAESAGEHKETSLAQSKLIFNVIHYVHECQNAC